MEVADKGTNAEAAKRADLQRVSLAVGYAELKKTFPKFERKAADKAVQHKMLYGEPIQVERAEVRDGSENSSVDLIDLNEWARILGHVRDEFADEFTDDRGELILQAACPARFCFNVGTINSWIRRSAPGLDRPPKRVRVFVWGSKSRRTYHLKSEMECIDNFISGEGEDWSKWMDAGETGFPQWFLRTYSDSDYHTRAAKNKIKVLVLGDIQTFVLDDPKEAPVGRLIRSKLRKIKRNGRGFWVLVYCRDDIQRIRAASNKTRSGYVRYRDIVAKYPAVAKWSRMWNEKKSGRLNCKWQIFPPGENYGVPQLQKIWLRSDIKKLDNRLKLPSLRLKKDASGNIEEQIEFIDGLHWGAQSTAVRHVNARAERYSRHQFQVLISTGKIDRRKDDEGRFRLGKDGPIWLYCIEHADEIGNEVTTTFSADYSTVIYKDGTVFNFSLLQAAILKFLLSQPTKSASNKAIGDHLTTLGTTVADTFYTLNAFRAGKARRKHPAVGRLLVTMSNGIYGLVL